MFPVWGRLMYKVDELVVYNPLGAKFWPTSMCKSFVLVFGFPLTHYRSWWLRGEPKILGLGRMMYLLIWESTGDADSVLIQLWLLPKKVVSMSGVFTQGLLLSQP